MLVNRRTFIVKRGAEQALLALLREAVRESGAGGFWSPRSRPSISSS